MKHAVVAQRCGAFGTRRSFDHCGSQDVVGDDRRLRHRRAADKQFYGFFLRAMARSMLRG